MIASLLLADVFLSPGLQTKATTIHRYLYIWGEQQNITTCYVLQVNQFTSCTNIFIFYFCNNNNNNNCIFHMKVENSPIIIPRKVLSVIIRILQTLF